MANIFKLVKDFTNLGIVGSITPAGVLMATNLLLLVAGPVLDSPLTTLLHRFSPRYEVSQRLEGLERARQDTQHDLRQARRRLLLRTRYEQAAEAALANATELRNHFRTTHLQRWTTRHDLRDDAQNALQEHQTEVNRLTGQVADAKLAVAHAQTTRDMYEARLQSIDQNISSLRNPCSGEDAQCLDHASLFFPGLIEGTLFILVLGWLIGILLNPVNKWLFTPSLLRRVPKRPITEDPLYLIGKNVITQEDYDSFVRRYHRFAQIAASLCLPVVVLGFVLLLWTTHNSLYYWSPPFALLAAVLLQQLAVHRNLEFRERVDKFIRGRLAFHRAQELREQEAEYHNHILALTKTIGEAARLLKLINSCGCTTADGKPESCKDALADVIAQARTVLERAKTYAPPKCRPATFDACVDALDEAVAEANRWLEDAQSSCCSECKAQLSACKAAVADAIAAARKVLELARSWSWSKWERPTTTREDRNVASDDADADANPEADADADAEKKE